MRLSVIISYILFTTVGTAAAQNAYFAVGRQAVMDGDFKRAMLLLEKACVIDSTNSDAYWMLGYSHYQKEEYKKCIVAFNKVISLKPAESSAYYYRARAKSFLAKDANASNADKEKALLGAIIDYTKSIDIEPGDMKFYQNRAIAYREYGAFKMQSSKPVDKARGAASLKASITDLEKVLSINPARADIENQLSLSKEKLAAALGHH